MASEMDPSSAAANALGQDVIDVATALVAAHIRAP